MGTKGVDGVVGARGDDRTKHEGDRRQRQPTETGPRPHAVTDVRRVEHRDTEASGDGRLNTLDRRAFHDPSVRAAGIGHRRGEPWFVQTLWSEGDERNLVDTVEVGVGRLHDRELIAPPHVVGRADSIASVEYLKQRHVDLTGIEPVGDDGGIADANLECDLRMGPTESARYLSELGGGDFFVAAKPDGAANARALKGIDSSIMGLDDRLGVRQQVSPVGGEHEALPVAPQEISSDALLEPTDLVTYR